jgi:hypothetical protein
MAGKSQDEKVKNKVLHELLEEIGQEKQRRVAFPFWGNWGNWGRRHWRDWHNWTNWLNWWT